MALIVKDRVKETTTTTGTGAIALAGAAVGFQSFLAAIGNGNSTYYTIADQGGANWEVGIGTYSSAGNTLSRDTVLSSSNSGALVNFTSAVKDVFVTQPTERTVIVDDLNYVRGANGAEGGKALLINAQVVTSNVVVAAGYNAMSVGPLSIASGVTVTLASGSRQIIF